jgi:hypothetical protein
MPSTATLPKLIPLPKVPDLSWLPYRPSRAAVYRWASLPGVRGCRLRTVVAGKIRCTTEPDLMAFFDSLGRQREEGVRARVSRPASAVAGSSEPTAAVDAELDDEGIG